MANQTTREGIARTVANQIQQKFQAKDVQVHLDGGWGYQSFAIQVGNGQALKSSGRPDRKLTIGSNSILIGEIDIWQGTIPLPYEGDPMLKTMLSQIFAALDRIRVAEGKRPYPKPQSTYSEGNSFQTIHS
jgi:hypothetical protein